MAMAGATTPNRRRTAQKPPQKDVWLFGSKQEREEAIDDIVRKVPEGRGRLKRMRAAELVSAQALRALRGGRRRTRRRGSRRVRAALVWTSLLRMSQGRLRRSQSTCQRDSGNTLRSHW